jgi:hypothetical protein
MSIDDAEDGLHGTIFEIAVDNLILLAPLENGCEGEHRERQATVAWLGCAGMKEDNHATFLVV